MLLLKLRISNFLSFGKDNSIDLKGLTQHTQLLGTNLEEDPEGGSSNGSGKTNLALALQEVVFSKNTRGIKKADLENREVVKGYSLGLDFIENCTNYTIEVNRTKAGKGTITLIEDGVDISSHTVRDTLKSIEALIKLDFNTFVQLTYQSTDKTFDILRANEAARTKLLITMYNMEEYTDRVSAAKDLSNCAKSALLEKSQLRKRLVFDADVNIEVYKELKTFDAGEELNLCRQGVSNLRSSLLGKNEHNARVDAEKARVAAHNTKQKLTRNKLLLLEKANKTLATFDEGLYEQVKLDIHTTKQEIKSLTKDIVIYSEQDKNCRECGASLETGFNAEKLKESREQLKISKSILDKLTFELVDLDKTRLINLAAEKTKKEIQWLKSTLENDLVTSLLSTTSNELNDEISTALSKLESLENEQKLVRIFNESAKIHNALQADRTTRKELASKQLLVLDIEINELTKEKALAETLEKALKLLVKFKLESLLITLQDSVNQYMNLLFNSDRSLLIGLKSGKLSFTVLKDNVEHTIESLSNGEYSKTAVALLFAVRESLVALSDTSVNLLFLDEVLAALDPLGVEALYNIIDTLDCKVISVSHTVFDNKLPTLTVEKNQEGISRIING